MCSLFHEKGNPQQKLSLILGIACTGCSISRITWLCGRNISRLTGLWISSGWGDISRLTGLWISSCWSDISGLTGLWISSGWRDISRLTRRRISSCWRISSGRRISARCRSRLLNINDSCLGLLLLLFSLLDCTDSQHLGD